MFQAPPQTSITPLQVISVGNSNYLARAGLVRELKAGQPLEPGDRLITGPDSFAAFRNADTGARTLPLENTRITLDKIISDPSTISPRSESVYSLESGLLALELLPDVHLQVKLTNILIENRTSFASTGFALIDVNNARVFLLSGQLAIIDLTGVTAGKAQPQAFIVTSNQSFNLTSHRLARIPPETNTFLKTIETRLQNLH